MGARMEEDISWLIQDAGIMVLVAKGKGSWVSEEYKHDSNSFSFYIQHCGSRAILLSPVGMSGYCDFAIAEEKS